MERREQLKGFLRSRRARLSPRDVGMPEAGRRRTPGLRREEVAVLAGVGVSWYTWLEQGRDITVSAQVLDAVARALRLDEAERTHLYLLAEVNPPVAPVSADRLSEQLLRVLDSWLPRPAFVLDRHWGLAAMNSAAREVFGFGDHDHNCLVSFFTSARYRASFVDWEAAAPTIVAQFRADAARHLGDGEFARIAGDLATVSAEFAVLWERHDVAESAQGLKSVTHPEVGELRLEYTGLALPDRPGYRILLHNPQPGTGTEEKLETLARRLRLVV
ncbi:helix-turn-helix transcriptional regulator [Microtetraspora malaysiensis]|uniref:helix-turn-helix transcriptional regulator n=1 Tax=Microtetraspora malaysiensis TaxID=161358 RepID=UPI003D9408F9